MADTSIREHAEVERFFDPLTIGNITARNRFAVAPMTRVSATEAGHATARMADYYGAFAEGGRQARERDAVAVDRTDDDVTFAPSPANRRTIAAPMPRLPPSTWERLVKGLISMTTEIRRARGRPRRFDPDEGVAVAQRMFHERGYEAVGVADVARALGINPPSLYAAYGSKAELYTRVLQRYTTSEGVPLTEILQPGRRIDEALSAVLNDAAERYAKDPEAAGCLAIEGATCSDTDARAAARTLTDAARETIRSFVAATRPNDAERLADFVVTIMVGLSTMARQGSDTERLRRVAHLAAEAIKQEA